MQPPRRQFHTSLAIGLVLATMTVGVVMLAPKRHQKHPMTADASANSSLASPISPGSSTSYRDGRYTTTATYLAPSGDETITVNLTLKNGLVTEADFQGDPNSSTSAEYQSAFASSYKEVVIGKPLNTLQLDHVSGSSLTTAGFNAALAKIRAQAKA